jgi:hypothetical protein
VTEAQFTGTVIHAARVLNWRVAHFRPARTAHGWRTPVQGDGVGWPDLVCVRKDRLVFAELKAPRGKVTPAQQQWLEDLGRCAETYLWREADWERIEAVLR